MAVRDSISSGHNILSTIHADKAESIPSRLYSLLESSIDLDQFLRSIHRYVQLGVHIKGYYSPELKRFKREVAEIVEFFVDDKNQPGHQLIYKRTPDGSTTINNPTKYLLSYLESQGVIMPADILVKSEFHEPTVSETTSTSTSGDTPVQNVGQSYANSVNVQNVGQNYSGGTNLPNSTSNYANYYQQMYYQQQGNPMNNYGYYGNATNTNYSTNAQYYAQNGIVNSNQMLYNVVDGSQTGMR